MSTRDTTGADDVLRGPSIEHQAEAAELAAKIAALPHGPPPRHGWLWWIWHGILWSVVLGLLLTALLRLFHHDGNHLLTWINAFTRYAYLPAYVGLVWALCARRWALSLVSAVVVGFHLAWMLPDFLRDRRFDMPATPLGRPQEETQNVRIFFSNILGTNTDFRPLWKEIEIAQPDIVVLAECSRASTRSFRETPTMAPFIRANGERRSQMGGVKIYSKLPIKAESQSWIVGRIVQTVDVAVGERTLRVIGIHSPRPQLPSYEYYDFWKQMVPLLAAEQGPLVVVGDFNATQHSLVYNQLKEIGLRSAHDDRGRGYATTWPNLYSPVPLIRIHQAFLSPHIECRNIAEGIGAGSDHRPLIVDVSLRDTVPRPAAARVE